MSVDISKYLTDGNIRHFNKKGEGSLTGISLSVAEDKQNPNDHVIFLSGLEYNGALKGEGMKGKITAALGDKDLEVLEAIVSKYHGYETKEGVTLKTAANEKGVKGYVIADNKAVTVLAMKNGDDLKISFLSKKENPEIKEVSFDLNYLESLKLLKTINQIKNVVTEQEAYENITKINKTLSSMELDDKSSYSVRGADGGIRKIQPVTIEHGSVNMNKDKLPVGSFLKFRNDFLSSKPEVGSLGSKYPITSVTQEAGYSFSLPIAEEISLAFEKFLKAYLIKSQGKASKFFTDEEERQLKKANIFSVYNKSGTDMYQFKIFSESGTVQYSINSKDKTLTVTRMGIATAEDVDRVRKNLVKMKGELQNGDLESTAFEKLKLKYDRLLDFGKKLSESNKNRKPYFTTFLKIDNPEELLFKTHLINSYVMDPTKSESEILSKNLNNLYGALEDGKISKEDAIAAVDGLDKLYPEKTFFSKDLILAKGEVFLSYDARHVFNLLNDTEDRNKKTFKFKFKNKGRETGMLLDLGDIKRFLDNNGNFKKEIDYELEGKKIHKKFEIKEDGSFEYEDGESSFSGKIDTDSLTKSLEYLKTDIIRSDINDGGFYQKNFAYYAYKLNHFEKNQELNGEAKKKTKMNKLK